MTRRVRLWLAAAGVVNLVNLAGAVVAAAQGEWMHANAHVVLLLLGTNFMWWLGTRTRREDAPSLRPAEERLAQLQQSVDAIALEVERIGESQRFSVKLEAERREPRR